MRKPFATIVLATAALFLGGCAGKNFVKPESAEFKLGETTYSQVVNKLGEPRGTGEVVKNGETMKTINYAYATTGGEPLQAGVIPARAMGYYFNRDVLVGKEFISSFKSDNSNFDEKKVPSIEKGKTTRAEVIRLLGRPYDAFVKPMVKETSGEAIGYSYSTTSGSAFTGLKFFRKAVRIAFDKDDKVLEVDYTTSGSK
jgi:outer membrane protein assembly factor BamE (lipoprotein component of BamABCDE complex)